jgi:crotonobetainyl-CoA:carnitine CoA-transferase CaiB-like acyl-CoA transferase
MLLLSGITGISLERAVAAPFTARQLAVRGARAIEIERRRWRLCAQL